MFRTTTPLLILFLIITGSLLLFRVPAEDAGFQPMVILAANSILFILGISVLIMLSNSFKNNNPHVFVRAVMGGMIIKMLVLAGALIAYLSISGEQYSKKAIWMALLLYVLYLVTEVFVALKMNRKKNA